MVSEELCIDDRYGETMWTVTELFRNTVNRTPGRTALVDPVTERRFTYAEVNEEVERVAAGLRSFDVEKGDRVGTALPNTPEHVFLLLAIQRIGAVAVPFDFRVSDDKLRYFVSDADLSLLVFGAAIAEQVLALREELACDTFVTTTEADDDVRPFDDLRGDPKSSVTATVNPSDSSVIQYSSGTTGDPKGIEITHRGGVDRALLNVHSQRAYDEEIVLGTIPLYHTIAFHGMFLSTFATDGTYVLLPHSHLDQARDVIAREDVTVLHEAPPIYKKLLDFEGRSDERAGVEDRDVFESVETVAVAAAPMSEDLFAVIEREIGPEYLYNTYGMTEIFPPYTKVNLRDRDDPQIFGYAEAADGMRIVETESRDPTAEVDPGRAGELIVRQDTPGAFDGYLHDYEGTADAFEGDWYFTGDACVESEDGYYVLTGRISDRIKFIGDNIYPKNVEAVLATHPAVEDVTVVGIEDDEWGEVPKAYVTTDGDPTASELQTHCVESDALEDYKKPRAVEFVDSLPEATDGQS